MGARILIVDDEKDFVDIVRTNLEANDFEVVTAFDGKEALEKAKKENPSLILLDVLLPFLNGFEVCRLLKFDQKFRAVPIVFLTSKVSEDDKKTGAEVGGDCYFTKPFESEKLLEKIKELVN